MVSYAYVFHVLPTSHLFTSGYVNTETILHFFNLKEEWKSYPYADLI